MTPWIEFSVDAHVARVHLNRPSALNAIDQTMEAALGEAWSAINSDAGIRVAILSGAGDRAFCAGADMASPPQPVNGISLGGGLTGIGGALVRLNKPLICAVHGHTLGLGFELAMCADILLAADNSLFGLPETRAGVIAHCGVVHRAIRQLPHHIALGMILAGERLDATRAEHFGLVNAVVAPDRLEEAMRAWVQRLLACSPLAVQAAKQAAIEGLECSLEDALRRHYRLIDFYAGSADMIEAAASWAERRPPRWRGR
jgi:crotonobetainyl-CoA hydratase